MAPATLMVVDDSADLRELVALYFARSGEFEIVAQAGNGQDAVRLAEEVRPAAVILDLRMPIMDGLQALPLLRERLPDACIVMWSSEEGPAAQEQALSSGADRYIPKSSPLDAVVDALRGCLAAVG